MNTEVTITIKLVIDPEMFDAPPDELRERLAEKALAAVDKVLITLGRWPANEARWLQD